MARGETIERVAQEDTSFNDAMHRYGIEGMPEVPDLNFNPYTGEPIRIDDRLQVGALVRHRREVDVITR